METTSEVIPTKSTEPRSGKALIDATRPYAIESVARSWWEVFTTLVPQVALIAIAAQPFAWPVRLVAAVLAGFVVARGFILYHDHMHGALLRGSVPARMLFWLYGVYVLTPPNVWRQTHNYHHAHTAKIVGSHVGSYLMLTTDLWQRISPRERVMYKIIRHPVTIAVGYFTIFLYGMCVAPFIRNPRKNWDSALTIVLHLALVAGITWRYGFATALFALIVPLAVAMALGAYLFYAQHNFPGIVVQPRETWSYTTAALESSSYLETGPVLRWFTGNIGYHHVHHLNSSIPFYRLPEAMAAIPELQHPHTTSLRPGDILACFRLKLWDPSLGRMVPYPR